MSSGTTNNNSTTNEIHAVRRQQIRDVFQGGPHTVKYFMYSFDNVVVMVRHPADVPCDAETVAHLKNQVEEALRSACGHPETAWMHNVGVQVAVGLNTSWDVVAATPAATAATAAEPTQQQQQQEQQSE